ncbi:MULTISPECIES: tyrosine-type recombinase/integrase [unclassified Fibrobacter]|uniref:tyrosine-type recombinase/integrase n=1 Tax=unclassified Fibrobacter TaxID=2634177 RepID=UPI000921B119|nr:MULTISPECIES: tyrosine-type recombinase/integrase [unclassified Fibrobacter]OWV08249.1 hypothetical protein B7993_01050 [Fibrobacter sp. UWH3]SHL20369.1 integrase/recombinase XerC [Fibrobacter sp. UWH6]
MESLCPQVFDCEQGSSVTGYQGLDFGMLYERFLAFIDVRPKSVETYRRAIRQFFDYMKMNSITSPVRDDVVAYRESMKAAGKSPSTIRLYLTAVKMFFQWLDMEGLYNNIAVRVKGCKQDKGFHKDYLTTNQAKLLLDSMPRDSVDQKRDYAIVRLSLTTGLRTIEVARSNVEDLRTVGDSLVLYVQGKGRDEKTTFVKVAPKAEAAIREYLAVRGRVAPSAPLFACASNVNKDGRLSTRSISRIEKNALVRAGLDSPRLTAHSLRHTAATLNLLNGGSLEETQQLLRHNNINTTLIYAHSLERAKNNSEMRIEQALG